MRLEEEREREEEEKRAREAQAKEAEDRYQKWAKAIKVGEVKPTYPSKEDIEMALNQDLLKEFATN